MKKQFQLISVFMFAALVVTACAPNVVNAQPDAPTSAPTAIAISTIPANTASIRGVVWHDVCMLAGGEGGAPIQPSVGCVSVGAGYQANGTREPDEPGFGDVLVSLGYGACGVADDYYEIRTSADGSYVFTNLAGGEYCIVVDSLRPENGALLPGQWTAPVDAMNTGAAQTNVTVMDGEQKADTNFGWDYQFLPLPDVQSVAPTPIASCVDSASYVADISIPDGTIISAGNTFVKTWRLRNSIKYYNALISCLAQTVQTG